MLVLISLQSRDDDYTLVGPYITSADCAVAKVEKVSQKELLGVFFEEPFPEHAEAIFLKEQNDVEFWEVYEDVNAEAIGCVEVHKI